MNAWTRWISISSITLASITAQANFGIMPSKYRMNNQIEKGAAPPAQKLSYYGGPVIPNAKVYGVFWSDYVDFHVKDYIKDFLSHMVNSNYLDWLSEYDTFINAADGSPGTQQHIGRGDFGGIITLKTANHHGSLSDNDIQIELQHQIDIGALPKPDDNTIYMTYFPEGIIIGAFGLSSCVDFCAYHSSHGTPTTTHFFYGVMPNIRGSCGGGCGFASNYQDSETMISSHELVEAITDPYPTGGAIPAKPQAWNTLDAEEIGDVCTGIKNDFNTPHDYYVVQGQWANSKNGCTNSKWSSP